MAKRQYRQYAMLVRVRNFGDTHKEQFPDASEGIRDVVEHEASGSA